MTTNNLTAEEKEIPYVNIDQEKKDNLILNNDNVLLQGITKAIEDKKDAEMNAKIEEIINDGKKTIEMMKTEEAKKLETLKKKTISLETKVKKKDEEIVELKNLMKLKQTNFVESLHSITSDFASKEKDLQSIILQKQKEIEDLEEKLRLSVGRDQISSSTGGDTSKRQKSSSNTEDDGINNFPSNDIEDFAQNNPGKQKKEGYKTCYRCGEEGHLSRQCNNLQTNKLWCSHCSKNTHATEKCWSLKPKNSKSTGKDLSKGKDTQKQPLKDSKMREAEKQKDDGNKIICQICNKRGHREKDCWHRNENNDNRCSVCNKFGHTGRNCRHRNKGDRCTKCKKFGHLEKDCWQNNAMNIPAANLQGKQNSYVHRARQSLKCKICKKFDHQEKDCKHRNNNNNGFDNLKSSNQSDTIRRNNDAICTSTHNSPVNKSANPSKNEDMLMLCMKILMDQWHQQKQN